MVGTGTYYLHEDALGSVRLETTTTVTVKFSSNYVPYGSNYAMTGKEVFMYIGQPYSSVTGLYYLGARYYDPTIGRFITEDSYEGDDNDPMTLNRYIYGRDNPERYEDPSGHMPLTPNDLGPDLQSMCAADPAACTSVTSSTSSTTSVVSADMYYTTYQKAVTTTTTTCFEGYCTSKTATNSITTWTVMNPGYSPIGVGQGVTNGAQSGCSLSGDCGAVVVAGGAVGLTTAGALIGGFTSTAGIAGVIVFGFATGFTIGYVIRNWGHATPQGALNAFEQGFGLASQNQYNPPNQNPPWWSLPNF